jgi:hypothetical protein
MRAREVIYDLFGVMLNGRWRGMEIGVVNAFNMSTTPIGQSCQLW